MKTTVKDRMRGCLVAGAAGDALGYAVEFIRLKSIKKEFGPDGITSYETDAMSGLAVISDDTQMTMFTATGLLTARTAELQGLKRKNEYAYVHNAYDDWYRTQTGQSVYRAVRNAPESWLLEVDSLYARRAPGITCLNALGTSRKRSLYSSLNNSKGCGGVMRVAPAGMITPIRPDDGQEEVERKLEKTVEMGAELSALTHGHPLGCFPSGIFAAIIQQAIYGDGTQSLLEMTEKAVAAAKRLYGKSDYWDELETMIDKTISFAGNDRSDAVNIKELGEGWVAEEALYVALYCALRYENDISAALIASVNHDGDSDSTGAIAGNILGALHGFDAIDEKWKLQLEMIGVIKGLADDMYRGSGYEDPEGGSLLADEEWMQKYGSSGQEAL